MSNNSLLDSMLNPEEEKIIACFSPEEVAAILSMLSPEALSHPVAGEALSYLLQEYRAWKGRAVLSEMLG